MTIAGWFGAVNGVPRGGVAKINSEGVLDTTFAPTSLSYYWVTCAAEQPDGKVVIGGYFTNVNGAAATRIARLNIDGSLDATFTTGTGFNNIPQAIIVENNGDILIGGSFTSYNASPAGPLVRLSSEGVLDPSFSLVFRAPSLPGSIGSVSCIVRQGDGKLLIGGRFNTVNEKERNEIVRLNTDRTVDESFIPEKHTSTGVRVLAIEPDGKILYADGGTTVRRLDHTGKLQTNLWLHFNGTVYSMAVQPDGKILVGGSFFYGDPNFTRSKNLARFLPNGALDPTLNFGESLDREVYSVVLQEDGKVILGGIFTFFGTPMKYLVRLNGGPFSAPRFSISPSNTFAAVGQRVTFSAQAWSLPAPTYQWTFNGSPLLGATNSVLELPAVAFSDAGRYALVASNSVGSLTNEAQLIVNPAHPVFVVHPESTSVISGRPTALSGFATGAGTVRYRWQQNGNILAAETNMTLRLPNPRLSDAGEYRLIASNDFGVAISEAASVAVSPSSAAAGALDVTFYPGSGADGAVWDAIETSEGAVLIAGSFTNVAAMTRHKVARLHPNGAVDPTFDPQLGRTGTVHSLIIDQSNRIVCGSSGTPVRLLSNGDLDRTFRAEQGYNTRVLSLGLQNDDKLLIAGDQSTPGAWGFIYRALTNGARDSSYDVAIGRPYGNSCPGGNCPYPTTVHALAIQPDGRVLFAGDFIQVNQTNRFRIARVLSTGQLDPTFSGETEPNGPIRALQLLPDGRILIAGWFTTINGIGRSRIARLHADGSLDPSFDVGQNIGGGILTMAICADEKVLIGGTFTNIGAASVSRVARLNANGSYDGTFVTGSGADGTVHKLLPLRNGKILIAGEFTSFDSVPRGGVARLNGDLKLLYPKFRDSRVELTVDTTPGYLVVLESRDTLSDSWSEVARIVTGDNQHTFEDSLLGSKARFYRVRRISE